MEFAPLNSKCFATIQTRSFGKGESHHAFGNRNSVESISAVFVPTLSAANGFREGRFSESIFVFGISIDTRRDYKALAFLRITTSDIQGLSIAADEYLNIRRISDRVQYIHRNTQAVVVE